MATPRLRELLANARDAAGRIVVLTGAGVSAASGIPTFRGPEGYWRVGSENYRAEQLATRAAFARMPAVIWGWYLHRRGVCLAAAPNAAHAALVRLEQRFGDRFLLITQNVDGLHGRAGNSTARTLEVHGSLHLARCSFGCVPPAPLPEGLGRDWPRDRVPDDAVAAALHCPNCGAWQRPHVLWFDECYDEALFRCDSALEALDRAALLLVVGTSGATNLPDQLVAMAAAARTALVVQNLEASPFSATAERQPNGAFVRGEAATWVPRIVELLGA